ncbi:MAG TPA: hypothetical protein VMN58_02920 [Acidimicrobiales bacterium]|nr:hypothetical protein [Acidimicrobiales bacterium]
MTASHRAAWLGGLRLVPLPAVATATTGGAIVVLGASGPPDRLRSWVVMTGLVLAAIVALAVDDPTESLAASAPIGRRVRWTIRAVATTTAAAAGLAWVIGVAVVSDGSSSATMVFSTMELDTLFLQFGTYVLVALAVAGHSVRRWGPGTGLRSAAPALVLVHLGVELIGGSWARLLPGADPGTARWWASLLVLAAAVYLLVSTDPTRHLSVVRR